MRSLSLVSILATLYAATFLAYRLWIALPAPRPWWLQALNTLALWAFAPTLLLPVWAALSPSLLRWGLALAAAALYAQRYLWFLWPRPRPRASERRLSLMTCNLLKDNRDCQGLVQALARSGADLIALQELKADHAAAIAQSLAERYPHQWLIPGQDDEGMGIISRLPLSERTASQVDAGAIPTLTAAVQVGKRTLRLLNAHTRIPVLQTRPFLGFQAPCGLDIAERRADLEHIVATCADLAGDLVVAGDLNLSDEEADYRLIPADWRSAYRARGRAPGLTYPVQVDFFGLFVRFPLFRIDHVFVRGGYEILSAVAVTVPGSDHRALQVELGWPLR